MPKLIIDNIEVEVPPGTNVLEAAKKIGVVIPHFCYHPALGSVGACRLCAMKFLEGPVKGIQMSCMIPAQDGMVVSTGDPDAVRMRSLVIEWLMTNHPHDCPVCDEGGECLLQDYTVAGGHGIRRYTGKKRTFIPQYLGETIEHEMNRCIECYRCVRFYQDYAGGGDFGVLGSARRVYFGRFADGALESPFSGNLVDICPTGVFTDKTARFRARYWDYEMAPSVCPHCSLGCNTTPAARYRELLKTMARRNDAVNGWFICDRGRFSNGAVNDPARPRKPLIDGREAEWDETLDALVIRLGEIIELYGAGSIALVGSPRLSMEACVLLPQLAELLETDALCFFTDGADAERAAAATTAAEAGIAASMAEVREADCIAIAGCDLLEEGPMMALAVRQAWRRGAKLFAVGDCGSVRLEKTLAISVTPAADLHAVPFAEHEHNVIICGEQGGTLPDLATVSAFGARLALLLSGPNACGAALLAREHGGRSLAELLEGGKVKGVIAVEADITPELLEGLPLIATLDWLPTSLVARSDIVLPVTSWVEMEGTFVNYEGRAQRFRQVMQPGLPIKGLDPAHHPPRAHREEPPGGNLLPSWRIVAALLERLGGEQVREVFAGQWEKLQDLDADGEGTRMP
jgi:NADH-quinone oxidoreductase subunit G